MGSCACHPEIDIGITLYPCGHGIPCYEGLGGEAEGQSHRGCLCHAGTGQLCRGRFCVRTFVRRVPPRSPLPLFIDVGTNGENCLPPNPLAGMA